MITKTIEIRDRNTFIPALAIRLDPSTEQDRYLLARAGFGLTPAEQGDYILLYPLTDLMSGKTANFDPYEWLDRTMQHAHIWIKEHFDEIKSGAVVDVEFILGDTLTPKVSESNTPA